MFTMKYLLPALAIAGTAAASSSCSGTTTLQNGGDATALAACSTYSGDVVIATGAAGNIAINTIQSITGSLTGLNGAQLTGLEADSLQTIGQQFSLQNMTVLSTLSFARLAQVGSINWIALPALQSLNFDTQVQKASGVLITDTQLGSLQGINLQEVDNFNINNNPYLNEINVQLGNITQSLNIEANGKNLSASFPNLEWAYNMTFRNCSSVSVPSLASVNGSMGFYSNEFTDFAAPNLTSTKQGSLVFVSNTALTNISLPVLTTIGGGYQIANNTKLSEVNGFTKLSTIAGALDFSGNFTSVDLPALSDVRGGFNMQSSAPLDCSAFQKEKSSGAIKGSFTCKGKLVKPSTKGSNPTASSSSSATSASATKKSAASGRFEVKAAAVVLSVFVAGLMHISF
ncbi:MAG: hypothetical protein M1819_007034 [Sarea resinae]|nr:MAG: hypothetical protein M1819_007034 [Sarea resinae]